MLSLDSFSVNQLLYLDRALNSWGDRCWEFAIGLYLIKLNPDSLILAALQGILASCLSIIIIPFLGRWISKAHRLTEISVFLFFQNFCVLIAASFVALFFLGDRFLGRSINKIIQLLSPYILVIFSAFAQVASSGYTLCLEKDWILMIAKDDQQLSVLNASLRRIDLVIKTISPLLVGLIIQYSDLASALFLMFFNLFSGLIEYLIMKVVFTKVIDLSKKKSPVTRVNSSSSDIIEMIGYKQSIASYIKHYGSRGISFSLMYLSVLGFDSITVGFVKSKGVSETIIGLVSVLGALTGIIGTLVFQWMVKHFNLNHIATMGYISDLAPLSLCLIMVFTFHGNNSSPSDPSMILFLTGITLSRVGLWITDLANNQLIQTTTPNPVLIGGIQNSLNTSAELTKFILTAILSKLSQFYILVLVSYFSVTIATILSICYIFHARFSPSKPKNNQIKNINLSVIEIPKEIE